MDGHPSGHPQGPGGQNPAYRPARCAFRRGPAGPHRCAELCRRSFLTGDLMASPTTHAGGGAGESGNLSEVDASPTRDDRDLPATDGSTTLDTDKLPAPQPNGA